MTLQQWQDLRQTWCSLWWIIQLAQVLSLTDALNVEKWMEASGCFIKNAFIMESLQISQDLKVKSVAFS